MRRMTGKAKTDPKRIVFAEGADIKVLLAIQEIVTEKIAHPILIGNTTEIENLKKQLHLKIDELTIFDPAVEKEKIREYTQAYYKLRQRKGITAEQAEELMHNSNFIGLMMVRIRRRGRTDIRHSLRLSPCTTGCQRHHRFTGMLQIRRGDAYRYP